jgi:hypothetical protein
MSLYLVSYSKLCTLQARIADAVPKLAFYVVGLGHDERVQGELTEINGALMRGKRPFPGNEARSDRELLRSPAIPMRKGDYSTAGALRVSLMGDIRVSACVRERRRPCWYAAPFCPLARPISIFGWMTIIERRFSCAGCS